MERPPCLADALNDVSGCESKPASPSSEPQPSLHELGMLLLKEFRESNQLMREVIAAQMMLVDSIERSDSEEDPEDLNSHYLDGSPRN